MNRPTLLVRRNRVLLTGYYLGLGVVMAVWGARMPSIQRGADLPPPSCRW
ncbi:hypothetical protein GCM10010267_66950 [Streptomyces griseorubens]|nr:hypothetical protein GCM10010267_66950 [Streptomyces griseorubens]